MITPWEILPRVQPLEVIAKAVAVTLAYLLGFAITSHFHEASSLTGAMLACVSAIVVQQQPDIRHAVQQGWLRVLGIVFSPPGPEKLWNRIRGTWLGTVILGVLFWACVYCMSVATNDPFMYFSF
mgnify:CR=1 FL=1